MKCEKYETHSYFKKSYGKILIRFTAIYFLKIKCHLHKQWIIEGKDIKFSIVWRVEGTAEIYSS